ncbi:hypothetical protein KA001_01750 [Patescibacteria group bacterium]|nr:hypothetical protein [Patescibacteria group bacterium]
MAIYINKEKAKKYLSSVNDEKAFFLEGGKKLLNIYELKDFLSNCDNETYEKYCNRAKNDFALWVYGVFENTRLKKSLESSRTAKEAKLFVERNIKMLERNI